MVYTYNRTASAKYDLYGNIMDVHRKAEELKWKGVQAVLAKMSRAAKPFGYTLDLNHSYVDFRIGRSDSDRAEGELLFIPLPSRSTWASEEEMEKFLQTTYDLYSFVRPMGEGKFRVPFGG